MSNLEEGVTDDLRARTLLSRMRDSKVLKEQITKYARTYQYSDRKPSYKFLRIMDRFIQEAREEGNRRTLLRGRHTVAPATATSSPPLRAAPPPPLARRP